jgi:hypothetical protein
MLQRIQSVYLLFAGLVIFALFLFPVIHNVYLDGVMNTIKVTGITDTSGRQHQPGSFTLLTIGTVIAGLVPLAVIFMYQNRKQQIMLVYVAMLIIIGYSFWLSQTVKAAVGDFQMKTDNVGVGMFLSSISILLLILAVKSIQKDEKLVRSADRLR